MKQPKLGKKIAALRKEKGLTQEELIEKCNVSIRTIQRIEAGEVTPRSYTINAIFEALEYNVAEAQAAQIAFEKSCEIEPHWLQEPKGWLVIGYFTFWFVVTFVLQLIGMSSLFILSSIGTFVSVELILSARYHKSRNPKMSIHNDKISIAYNRFEILGFLAFFLTAIIFSTPFTITPQDDIGFSYDLLFPIFILLFLGFAFKQTLLLFVNKIVSQKTGLYISDKGIEDNSSLLETGFIAWNEIESIQIKEKMYGSRCIVIMLKHPEDFIRKYRKSYEKMAIKINMEKFGSPLRIETRTLYISTKELYQILCVRFKKFQSHTM
ncbi:MAG: helix-turn-helix domain-containing protein [Bacteroidota bacterium]